MKSDSLPVFMEILEISVYSYQFRFVVKFDYVLVNKVLSLALTVFQNFKKKSVLTITVSIFLTV